MVLGHTRISRGSLHLFSHHCFPLRLILYPKLWFRDIHSPVFYGRKNTTETRAFGPNCHTYFPIRRNCLHIGVAQLQIKLAFAPKKKIPQYLVFLNSTSRAKIKLIMIKKKKTDCWHCPNFSQKDPIKHGPIPPTWRILHGELLFRSFRKIYWYFLFDESSFSWLPVEYFRHGYFSFFENIW